MIISFNLFTNKKLKDNHPDRKGNGKDENGNEYDIVGWIKQDKNGNPYLSCKLSEKREQQGQQTQGTIGEAYGKANVTYGQSDVARPVDNGKDDLPF